MRMVAVILLMLVVGGCVHDHEHDRVQECKLQKIQDQLKVQGWEKKIGTGEMDRKEFDNLIGSLDGSRQMSCMTGGLCCVD